MGGEWTKALLGDICQLKAGGAFKKELQGNSHGELPFIKVSDMNLAGNELYIKNANNWVSKETAKNIRAPIHPAGSVVFAKIGVALTYNRRRILTRNTLIDNNMMSATPDAKHVDPRFFYYLLVNIDFNKIVEGSALPYLKASTINSIDVLIPNISEQRAIAHILGTLDDKIELNRQMNRTLEAMAQALFKSWFIDFDPVVVNALRADNPIPEKFAQRAAHYRNNPRALSLPEDILRLFPDRFQDSELGPIPEGWKLSTIGAEFDLTMGQSPPGATYNENGNGMPFFQGRRDFGFRYPSLRVYCTAPARIANAGDTLVSVRAPVGDINMAYDTCCVGRGVAAVRHKSGSRSYTYYAMQSLGERFKRFEAEGTVFGSINKKQFQGLPSVKVAPDIITLFESLAYPIDENIRSNEEEMQSLAKLRDTLLPKLISGELRVPDAEKLLEDAL